MPRHSGGYEPERRAKPVQRPKAKKRSGIRGLFWGLYKLAVVLSALIVFGYVGLSVALRPPEIPSQTTGQGQTGQTAVNQVNIGMTGARNKAHQCHPSMYAALWAMYSSAISLARE